MAVFVLSLVVFLFLLFILRTRLKQDIRHTNSFLWHRDSFVKAMQSAEEYLELAQRISDTHDVKQSDCLKHAESALLTAASRMSPFCIGTANLFRYVDGPGTTRTLKSSSHVGTIFARQILFEQGSLREMAISADSRLSDLSVAARTARSTRVVIENISHTNFASPHEVEGGITHILGIPANEDWQRPLATDQQQSLLT